MTPERGQFLRDNAFLVAAVSLPLVVVAFFLLSTAIPRWTVPPPAYDLLLRANDVYNITQTNPRVTEFTVRDGKVEATLRAIPANAYQSRTALFLFDHATMTAREILVDFPGRLVLAEGDPPRTVVVETPPGRVLAQAKAPDGYQLETRSQRGPGIVGELFGMNRYNSNTVLTNRGRVVPVTLPGPYQNQYVSSVSAVGWLVPESGNGQR